MTCPVYFVTVSDAPARRFTYEDARVGLKDPDSWWTVTITDPVALRVAPYVLRIKALTPNVITAISIVLAVICGLVFLAGYPVIAALLFGFARFADNMDGKVARVRKLSSQWGAFFDTAGDFVRMGWVYSCVGIWLAARHELPQRLALLPALCVLAWVWATFQLSLHRSAAGVRPAAQGRPSWRARHRMNRLPGSVDAAGVALVLAPLSANPRVMAVVLWVVIIGFYVPAALRNVALTFRILSQEDAKRTAAPIT